MASPYALGEIDEIPFRPDILKDSRETIATCEKILSESVQAIGFGIAILGQSSLYINNPDTHYTL